MVLPRTFIHPEADVLQQLKVPLPMWHGVERGGTLSHVWKIRLIETLHVRAVAGAVYWKSDQHERKGSKAC